MAFKSDVQATRSDAAAGASAIIAPPIRLRGIIIASDGTGAGTLELTTTSNSGTTLFQADVPSGDVINFNFPEDGILFPKGVFCKTKTKVTAYTLLTDKYSGPNMTSDNPGQNMSGGGSFTSDQSVVHATSTTQMVPTTRRARLTSIQGKGNSASGSIIFKSGGAAGTTVATYLFGEEGLDMYLPGSGILFAEGIHATISGTGGVTITFT